jgi:hypothetical protein
LTVWVLSTWAFDSLPAPPTLAIAGNFSPSHGALPCPTSLRPSRPGSRGH